MKKVEITMKLKTHLGCCERHSVTICIVLKVIACGKEVDIF